jgi:hypothetical protein
VYLFLGIFPSCRPKAIRKNHEIASFDPKDKRKEEKTLSSFYFLSVCVCLSLSPQRDHARESVVPSLSVVVVVNVITRLREREDVSLNYFTQKKGSKGQGPPPLVLINNNNTSKKNKRVFV